MTDEWSGPVEFGSEADCGKYNVNDDSEPPLGGMRRWVTDLVRKLRGHGERCIMQKRLSESDLKNRMSMPTIHLVVESDEFLSEGEIEAFLRWKNHDEDYRRFERTVEAVLVEPCLRTSDLSLRKWGDGRHGIIKFAIDKKKWHEIAQRNGLNKDDIVQIWFFRSRIGNPCFALINLAAAQENQRPTTSDATTSATSSI
ncbi:hypothetical protein L484_014723 [Morus notabilis]|uniref:B3 domain-containing protein n=1 Tax=Morus notabilis TaxID=981085 RepID=W9QPG3_9ROSA|nr:putative B3 domain-containing protein At2g27410 [Morus notabilis]EXB31242.1 hypothetical protein L484_014723 [Morus notabilis]